MEAEELFSGVVKSWNGSKGYGFITSELVNGDVFFSRNELPPEAREVRGTFLEGRQVSFEAAEGTDGRVKATSVAILAMEGQPLAGIIKSYSEQNRYGFVQSSSLSDDVRFQSSDLPPMPPGVNLKGKPVIFEMQQLADGKLRVTKIQFQTSKIAAAVTHGGGGGGAWVPGGAGAWVGGGFGAHGGGGAFGGMMALPAAPHAAAYQSQRQNGSLTGSVKSFSERHGYGFITSPGQGGDIKFGKVDLLVESISPGAFVSFILATSPDGRLQAKQVQPAAPKRVASPAFAGMGGQSGGFNNIRPLKQPRTISPYGGGGGSSNKAAGGMASGAVLRGSVKSYIPNKGFGFITSPGLEGDIYFMRQQVQPVEEQMSELKGRSVSYELAYAPDGKFRAQSVTLC